MNSDKQEAISQPAKLFSQVVKISRPTKFPEALISWHFLLFFPSGL